LNTGEIQCGHAPFEISEESTHDADARDFSSEWTPEMGNSGHVPLQLRTQLQRFLKLKSSSNSARRSGQENSAPTPIGFLRFFFNSSSNSRLTSKTPLQLQV
jgi:hypothetical protein